MLRVVNPYIYAQNFTLYLCVCVIVFLGTLVCIEEYLELMSKLLQRMTGILRQHSFARYLFEYNK